MKPSLQIIVSCSNRKTAPVSNDLQLRTVTTDDIESRVHEWCRRLADHRGTTTAAERLYAGEHWVVTKELPTLAQEVGFKPSLWIMSAGYGLVPASACIHPYSATFASDELDSVTATAIPEQPRDPMLQTWWGSLCQFAGGGKDEPHSLTDLLMNSRRSYFLLVASPYYLSAVEKDLQSALLALASPERLMIVTSPSKLTNGLLRHHSVCSSARLQSRLGGSCVSLHARVASLILKKVNSWGFDAKTVGKRIEALIAKSPQRENFQRQQITDRQVRQFVKVNLKSTPQLSCSMLLRRLRDSGFACEQSRFKELYWEVRGD
ncbi:MAG: hypothetical protein AB7U82_25690 [Blastocatellales bacterium]